MRDAATYLEDILSAIERIESYTSGFDASKLRDSPLIQDAVLRNLLVIGEAAKRVPEALKHEYPSVQWRSIAGLRDIIVHDYSGIDLDIISDVVGNNLSQLYRQIQLILTK